MRYFIGNWKMFGVPKSINILDKINYFYSKDKNRKKTKNSGAKLSFFGVGAARHTSPYPSDPARTRATRPIPERPGP